MTRGRWEWSVCRFGLSWTALAWANTHAPGICIGLMGVVAVLGGLLVVNTLKYLYVTARWMWRGY